MNNGGRQRYFSFSRKGKKELPVWDHGNSVPIGKKLYIYINILIY